MNKSKRMAVIFMGISFIFFSLSLYIIYGINTRINAGKDKVEINSFVGEYEISNTDFNKFKDKMDSIEKDLRSKMITLLINEKEYKYTLGDLGIRLNQDELLEEISEYQNSLDYWTLYNNYSKNNFEKIIYDYDFIIDEDELRNTLTEAKKVVDVKPVAGKLSMGNDRVLRYINEKVGFSLNIDNNIQLIKDNFKTMNYNANLTLVGDPVYTTDKMKNMTTKISSFTTTFDDTVSRKYNLIAGAKYIDGVILAPGEVFSFYNHAGPFNKEGYAYYLGVIGNGVCQVASTLYNAQLLAGLETVLRYNHGIKSVYVPGGLDATVASTKGVITDYKFRNNLKSSVYISAFVEGGKLTVEMWSSDNALEGKTYETESVKLGYGSYRALRHVYKDGKKIETQDLGISYYFSE